MDTGHMSAGLYAEAENCPEEDFAEWHRRQNLWWEKCWTDRGRAPGDSMQEALEWVLRVKNRYGIRVLNISVGIGDLKERYKEQMLRKSLELLWDHNILVVCAAGNTGPEDG